MAPGVHVLEFDGREDIGAGAVALRFRPRRRVGHVAGQHGFWRIPRGGLGPFTIASAPEEPHLVLATTAGTHSRLKRALGALEPGARVQLAGPLSSFTLDGAGHDVVMLAQGIGITPFRAMLTHVAATGADVATTLVHVGAAEGPRAGHPYRAETEAAATRAAYPVGREDFAAHLATVTAERPGATYLVAGTSAFAKATAAALAEHGVDRRQVRRDAFYGWSGPRA